MILFGGDRTATPQKYRAAISQSNALGWVIGLSVYADIRVDVRLKRAGDGKATPQEYPGGKGAVCVDG